MAHCLVTNDCARVHLSFFETHDHAPYPEEIARKGWDGEEAVFEMERERLMSTSPSLASLVIPYYKVKQQPPGYDILSFNDQGRPVAIEVKTSVSAAEIGILPDVLCRYETRERRCMVPTYQKPAEALEVTVDELLETYPISALQ